MTEMITTTGRKISTKHLKVGDAQLPKNTLDRDQEPAGGLEQEDVEDRPNVSTVKPEDYPRDQPDA